jgi:hypothetical protein
VVPIESASPTEHSRPRKKAIALVRDPIGTVVFVLALVSNKERLSEPSADIG